MAIAVLWLSKGLGPGGAERLLVELAGTHSRAVDLRAAYVLPWKDHLASELEAAGAPVTCLSTRRRDPLWPWHLRRLLTDQPVDIVHTHSPMVAAVARTVIATLPRRIRPVVVSTEHNAWPTHHPASRWANRLTARHDGGTLAVSDEVTASLRGPAAVRARTLMHGIDVERVAALRDQRDAVRAELDLPARALVIGTVANFRVQKDYPNLLRAFRRLLDGGTTAHLVAVGQGPLEEEIGTHVAEMGLRERVVLTGFRADAARVMSAFDVFTLASAWEGLPVALMEALALGLPVVATAVGGVAEALRSPQDAILVPPRDHEALAEAWRRVLRDTDERHRLAAAASAVAPRYDVRRAAAEIEALYVSLVPGRGRAAAKTARAARAKATRRPPALPIRALEAADQPQVLELLAASLGWTVDDRYREFFEWKHWRNAFGRSIGLVAVDGERIAALRLFMRWEFVRGGRTLRAVRAVDTATHPDYQRRGLFEALTLAALDVAADDGVDFVFNTPNEQSRPGYLKMGWRTVGRLPAAARPAGVRALMRMAGARVPAEHWSIPFDGGKTIGDWLDAGGREALARALPVANPTDRDLRTRLDPDVLDWQYGLPSLHYRAFTGDEATLICRVRRRGAARELAIGAQLGPQAEADRLAATVMRQVGADYAIRLGTAAPRRGFLPTPGGGPVLTWKAVHEQGMPPLPNWRVQLGDIALF